MARERVSNKASWKHFWSSAEKKKADKSRFGPKLTEAEIDALVEELLFLVSLIKQLFCSGLLDIEWLIITNSALRASLVIYHFISSARLVEQLLISITQLVD